MTDFMREIEEGSAYSLRIVECLKQKEEMPHIIDDALNEYSLRTDCLRRIICFVFMPPPMQSLHTEATEIHRRLCGRFLDEEDKQLQATLRVRMNLIEQMLLDWLKKELAQNKGNAYIVARLENEIYKFGVGANWRMLVFEHLPKPAMHTL